VTAAVRHAVRADLDELEATLTDAFATDPVTAFMYPDPATRPEHSAAFLRVMLEIGFPHGHVYAAGPRNDAVAIWVPPDVELFDEPGVAKLWPVLERTLGDRVDVVTTGLMQVTAAHPTDRGPHFYLAEIGTRASAQSQGLGSLLMREILDRCDRQGLGAYLESSNIRNVPFYERHGFEVTTELEIAPDCTLRPMWRDPR
jgi:ribosomal protein S18 acetylase RimI-like enzyme